MSSIEREPAENLPEENPYNLARRLKLEELKRRQANRVIKRLRQPTGTERRKKEVGDK